MSSIVNVVSIPTTINVTPTGTTINGETVVTVLVLPSEGPVGPQGTPGASGMGVPVGGTAGQMLAKLSSTDFDTVWLDPDEPGAGIPAGGAQGEALVKNSSSDFDLGWTAMTYTHVQNTPANVWTVTHNLGRCPAATVVDSGGSVVIGGIQHLSVNQIQVTFSSSFSGTLYLS